MNKNWFTITQIKKNIFSLAEFSHWEKVVSYLIVDKSQAFLIDTGMGYASIKHEVEKITTLPVTVLITHSHWDHIGSCNEFEKLHVFDHPFEKKNLKYGFSSNEITELTDKEMFSNGFLPIEYVVKGVNSFSVLQDKKFISSDNYHIETIHTPGHTPGSVCFYISELDALFTGDTLYPGPLYAQMTESSITDYVTSIKKLQKYKSTGLAIFPGHNDVISNQQLLIEADELFTKIENGIDSDEVLGEYLSVKLK